jgi:hypothetical protein
MSAEQLSRAELRQMPPAEIVKARREGKLSELLAGRDPGEPEEERNRYTPPPDTPEGAQGKTYPSARAGSPRCPPSGS